jgi:hypothetical protein
LLHSKANLLLVAIAFKILESHSFSDIKTTFEIATIPRNDSKAD